MLGLAGLGARLSRFDAQLYTIQEHQPSLGLLGLAGLGARLGKAITAASSRGQSWPVRLNIRETRADRATRIPKPVLCEMIVRRTRAIVRQDVCRARVHLEPKLSHIIIIIIFTYQLISIIISS